MDFAPFFVLVFSFSLCILSCAESITERLSKLENELSNHSETLKKVSKLEDQLSNHRETLKKVSRLEDELSNHRETLKNHRETLKKVSKLENDLLNHRETLKKVSKLEDELSSHKEAVRKLEERTRSQINVINELNNTCITGHSLISQSTNRVKRVAEAVAFTAFMDKDAQHLGNNQPLPFNNVLTNIGGGYHPLTYIFTCPVSGVYLFSFAIAEVYVSQICARLVIDGQNVVDAIADPFHNGQDIQASNVAVIQVNKGQTVWVANYNGGDSFYRSDDGFRYCTFSGVLIQPS